MGFDTIKINLVVFVLVFGGGKKLLIDGGYYSLTENSAKIINFS